MNSSRGCAHSQMCDEMCDQVLDHECDQQMHDHCVCELTNQLQRIAARHASSTMTSAVNNCGYALLAWCLHKHWVQTSAAAEGCQRVSP
jgi:hypothetical protein